MYYQLVVVFLTGSCSCSCWSKLSNLGCSFCYSFSGSSKYSVDYTMAPLTFPEPLVPMGSTMRFRGCLGPGPGNSAMRLCVYLPPPPAMEPVVLFHTGHCWVVDRSVESFRPRINFWNGLTPQEKSKQSRLCRSECEVAIQTQVLVSELRALAEARLFEVIVIVD